MPFLVPDVPLLLLCLAAGKPQGGEDEPTVHREVQEAEADSDQGDDAQGDLEQEAIRQALQENPELAQEFGGQFAAKVSGDNNTCRVQRRGYHIEAGCCPNLLVCLPVVLF